MQMNPITRRPPTPEMLMAVMEAATESRQVTIAEACERLLVAKRLGWSKHALLEDWTLVEAFIH